MNSSKRLIAMVEALFVFPAVLFMSALFVRELQPPQYEPARSARRLVEWFGARPFLCLDIFLIALPLTVLVIGCATLLRSWRGDAELRESAFAALATARTHLSVLVIAGATLVAASVLTIVALHLITD